MAPNPASAAAPAMPSPSQNLPSRPADLLRHPALPSLQRTSVRFRSGALSGLHLLGRLGPVLFGTLRKPLTRPPRAPACPLVLGANGKTPEAPSAHPLRRLVIAASAKTFVFCTEAPAPSTLFAPNYSAARVTAPRLRSKLGRKHFARSSCRPSDTPDRQPATRLSKKSTRASRRLLQLWKLQRALRFTPPEPTFAPGARALVRRCLPNQSAGPCALRSSPPRPRRHLSRNGCTTNSAESASDDAT